MNKLSFLRLILNTKQAKEAMGDGLLHFIDSGNLSDGVDAMIKRGKQNGSWPAAKLAFVFDLLGLSK